MNRRAFLFGSASTAAALAVGSRLPVARVVGKSPALALPYEAANAQLLAYCRADVEFTIYMEHCLEQIRRNVTGPGKFFGDSEKSLDNLHQRRYVRLHTNEPNQGNAANGALFQAKEN